MAVAFDAVGPSGGAGAAGTGTSPLSWTHTTSGSNRLLLAWCAFDGVSALVSATATCTKGGTATAMTSLGTIFSGGITAGYIQAWWILAPDSGACTVTVSWTGTSPADTHGGSVSYTGAGGVGAPVLVASSGAATSGSVAVPGTTSGNIIAAGWTDGSAGTVFTAGTQRVWANSVGSGAAGDLAIADLASPGGTGTITWTQTSDDWGAIGVEVQVPAAGSVTFTPQRYGQAASSPAPWEQRLYRSVPGAVDTPANPLASPLDSAWQADAGYWHAYGDSALRDRRQYFQQRPLVSDPSLLGPTGPFDPTLGARIPGWLAYNTAATHGDRREVPAQKDRRDANTVATAANPLPSPLDAAFGAGGHYGHLYAQAAEFTDRREVPQQRAYASQAAAPVITQILGTGTGQYWGDQNGNPRAAFGDTAWPVIYMSGVNGGATTWQSDIDNFIATRAGQGYTAIECNALGNTVEGNATTLGKTWDSVNAFGGSNDPTSGLNAAYWQRLDRLLDKAAAQGITIFLNLCMSDDLTASVGIANTWTNTQFTNYGNGVATRYLSRQNLIWMIGDDYFGNNDTQFSAILTGIRNAGDTRPIGIENYTESTSQRDFQTGAALPWGTSNAGFSWTYSYNVAYLACEEGYKDSRKILVMRGDGYYYDGTAAGDQLQRQHTWWSLSSGSRGFFGGIFSGDAGWATPLTDITSGSYQGSAGSGWISAIITYFTGLAGWHRLIPDTGNAFITAGTRGTRATPFTSGQGSTPAYSGTTDTYVSGAITAAGDLAVLYWARGATATITINQALLGPGYTATWVDPASCATSAGTPGSTFTKPASANSAGDNDWVLVLQGPPVAAAAAPQRYGQAAAPWPPQQRPYISDPSFYPAAILPPSPLDTAWQAGGGYWHLYNRGAWWRDRLPAQQRPLVSDPSLLGGAPSDPLLGEAEARGRRYHAAALLYDRREVPQQRPYVSDPLLLGTALLENELLGGAQTWAHYVTADWYDRREVPQQRPYVSDPLLLTTAELENELLGGAQTARTYGTSAANAARWWMPQQPARLADPLLIATAELENELLGGAATWLHYITSAYIDRREVPQQRPYISDPSAYPAPNPLDPLLAGQDCLDGHQHQAATHYDRREVPQQRAYISDPSFYPSGAVTDPLTVAWGAGGPYWHLYNRAGDITDRREYFPQRLYQSDPLLLLSALLENELLGGAETGKYYRTPATHGPRWWMPQQPPRLADPLLIQTAELENELLGGGDYSRQFTAALYYDRREMPQQPPRLALQAPLIPLDPTQSAWAALWLAYNLAATHVGRRLYPQQRLYFPVPLPPPPFTTGTLTAADAAFAVLTATAAAGATGGAVLTATDQRTGGPS